MPIDVDLNKKINAMWAQIPEESGLADKFYAYLSTDQVEKLREIISSNPLLKEIALTDQNIIRGPLFHFDLATVAYLVNDIGLDVEQPRQEELNRTLLMQILRMHHSEHRDVNLSEKVKFEMKYMTVQVLLVLEANSNAIDTTASTPLHYAIACLRLTDLLGSNYGVRIVKLLLGNGAKPNAQDHNGRTPLHLLLAYNKIPLYILEPMIRLLIQYGADETIPDLSGITPKLMVLQHAPLKNISDKED